MRRSDIRQAVFAGRFYPSHKKDIAKLYETVLLSEELKINYDLADEKAIGAIMPHAGFMYCGYQAIHTLEILRTTERKFDTIIIVNPNHTGYGEDISVDGNKFWKTPLGDLEVDQDFVNCLALSVSDLAHQYEHSGEVILPFLHYALNYDFKIVPICLSIQDHGHARKVALAIFNANQVLKKEILVVASSDFSHFVSPEYGYMLDKPVIDAIEKLNSYEVERLVKAKQISICGFGPIIALIEYMKLNCEDPELSHLRGGHSGEVHPSSEVVHYHSFYGTDSSAP